MSPSSPCLVAMLIDELETRGGTENHLIDLLSGLDRRRIEPTVVVLTLAGLLPEVRKLGVAAHSLEITSLLGLDGARTLLRLRALFGKVRPDLVVTYHPSSDLLGPVAARSVGTRVISCRRDLGFTRHAKHRLLQRPANLLVHGMIAVSEAVRASVTRTERFAAERIEVIPNGCDLERFHETESRVRDELGIGPSEVVVGTLSNFGKIKGYDVIVPAALELVRARPEVRFVFVGKDEARDSEMARWQEMARAAGHRIIFAGSRRDVPEVLSAMDIFLQASHSEGFSNSILQAMACARPVIATDVGGNRELVDPASGILIPRGDGRSLVDAVTILLDDPDRRRRMGRSGRQRASEHFSKERMVERYQRAFERFAGQRSRG
ncbi:MAG: glycosyltransferase [Deltaproteobacteria bacterium]|nr:glycosyltransferase [Deltaproteobacteria bacterium]